MRCNITGISVNRETPDLLPVCDSFRMQRRVSVGSPVLTIEYTIVLGRLIVDVSEVLHKLISIRIKIHVVMRKLLSDLQHANRPCLACHKH